MSSPGASFTDRQGQYLAFIDAYTRVNGRPPAEADMQRHFRVSPPSVHQMVLTLERAGLIRRQPGLARSARRADPATARPRPKHRSVGRPQTPARPIPNPTGQSLRAEELAYPESRLRA